MKAQVKVEPIVVVNATTQKQSKEFGLTVDLKQFTWKSRQQAERVARQIQKALQL